MEICILVSFLLFSEFNSSSCFALKFLFPKRTDINTYDTSSEWNIFLMHHCLVTLPHQFISFLTLIIGVLLVFRFLFSKWNEVNLSFSHLNIYKFVCLNETVCFCRNSLFTEWIHTYLNCEYCLQNNNNNHLLNEHKERVLNLTIVYNLSERIGYNFQLLYI